MWQWPGPCPAPTKLQGALYESRIQEKLVSMQQKAVKFRYPLFLNVNEFFVFLALSLVFFKILKNISLTKLKVGTRFFGCMIIE